MGVFVRVFVCSFGSLLIRVSLCFLGWLVVCVYVCLDAIATFGAQFCHARWTILRVFNIGQDLGAQFADPWAPFGHLGDPFWCICMSLGPDP